ncbi:RDD family protein [Radiobacillus deserti]|uniref:RDD family protein n=1 Tax=Radiobacillus deserti TaxID=2594883 RepID=A0A516KIA5_9BACI|nr:RDD family protein [Radiobacillus deserti]QDP41119.1 RDD family protein [Radiobacillus deserti]
MGVINPAGFSERFVASLVDGLLIFISTGFLGLLIYGEFYSMKYRIIDELGLVYHIVLPLCWYGYTVGKRARKIRIVKMDGSNVGIGTMLLRILVAGIIYLLTLGIGIIVSAFMVALREDKRAIHDFIASTYVTEEPPGSERLTV